MSEVTSGIRAVLSFAGVYDALQNALGAAHYRRKIASAYLPPNPLRKLRVLDVGCGTAQILDYLPECTYVGVDLSQRYVAAAKRRYGDRATFVCVEATRASFEQWRGEFDCVLMLGLLHHLDDIDAVSLFRAVGIALAPHGRVVSVDPTVSHGTHAVGQFLVARDRGRNVRPAHGYEALARQAFDRTIVHVRHDLLRVPYSHAILECSEPPAQDSSVGKRAHT